MYRRTVLKGVVALATAATGSVVCNEGHASPTAKLAIIVAPNSSLVQLSRFQLKQIYLGESIRDPAGENVVPFNHAQNTEGRIAFDRNVLGMSPEEVVRYWIDRKIRGQRGAPRTVPSVDLLQRVIERLEHAIGYVRADQVRPGLRVLPIDGRLPNDIAYDVGSTASRSLVGLL